MVALKKYARIEATGLWRASPEAQRREVVVVLGDATLTIKTPSDKALAHWSIAAIARANPGKTPAQFHPDGDPDEILELAAEEAEMVEVIETLRKAIDQARPHPGRVRWLGLATSAAAVAYGAFFWLPGALVDHTITVVPNVGRVEIGQSLLTRIQRVTGPACGTSANFSSLARLTTRLDVPSIAVVRDGIEDALLLPGGLALVSRQLVEDYEEPDVMAGYILAERSAAAGADPLRQVLEHGGTYATFRLLTTGHLDKSTLDSFAEHVLTTPRAEPDDRYVIAAFEQAGLRSSPYAYARDITGESVLPLIEGDPMHGQPVSPLMSDADWLRLQSICG